MRDLETFKKMLLADTDGLEGEGVAQGLGTGEGSWLHGWKVRPLSASLSASQRVLTICERGPIGATCWDSRRATGSAASPIDRECSWGDQRQTFVYSNLCTSHPVRRGGRWRR